MISKITALCLTAAMLLRVVDTIGPVVRCAPCDSEALEQCNPLPADCVESVREPGCGCCMTCALSEGQFCGVYTRKCGAGLSCQLQAGETKPLKALLEGRGICVNTTSKKLPAGEQAESPQSLRLTAEPAGARADAQGSRVAPGASERRPPPHHAKAEVIRKEQSRKSQSFKVQQLVPGAVHTDTHNFSLESKRELEYGPCRREMNTMFNSMKVTETLSARGLRIPNCDKKGFYKRKQCRPSAGRKRGVCWYVDKYGQILPGHDGSRRAGGQCHGLDNK